MTDPMFDVIVVGARCARAPLAMLLARQGHRTLLVDRATFPSDTLSTHILWPHGARDVQREPEARLLPAARRRSKGATPRIDRLPARFPHLNRPMLRSFRVGANDFETYVV